VILANIILHVFLTVNILHTCLLYTLYIFSFSTDQSAMSLTFKTQYTQIVWFSGVRVTRSLVLCVCFVDRCLSVCTFLLTIVLSVLLQYTDSDYPFGIFSLV
jgi:hypothetical protein